jgi:signal transduction histidine kinase/CheY-like chemotaxis protein
VTIVLSVLILPCFLALFSAMVGVRDDDKYAVWATGSNRPLAFFVFLLFVPAMCFFWVQIYLGRPEGSDIQLFPSHPFTFRIVDGVTIMGQLCLNGIGSLVYFAIFRPLFPWACAFTSWLVMVQLSFVVFMTSGFTSVSSGFIAVMFGFQVLSASLMLISQFSLEQTQRALFVHGRNLQLALESERKLRTLRADVAHEKGRAKAERLITAFLCHEIRNPMNGILGYAEQLSDQSAHVSSKEAPKLAATILSCSKHVLMILDHVLDISKLEAGKLCMQKDAIVCTELCAELQSSMGSRAPKGVNFVCKAQAGLILIGDRMRWMQTLMNLAGNALKFTTQANGFVKVFIRKTDAGTILCEVLDSGAIIPMDVQQRLFNKYEQAKNLKVKKTPHCGSSSVPLISPFLQIGTGLGLVIAQNIVQMMGSEVKHSTPFCSCSCAKMSSLLLSRAHLRVQLRRRLRADRLFLCIPQIVVESPWQADDSPGSRFYFELTEFEEAAASSVVPPSPSAVPEHVPSPEISGSNLRRITSKQKMEEALQGMRVLLVEDDTMNRKIMNFKLQKSHEFRDYGITCDEASSGEQAFEMFTEAWEPNRDPNSMWDLVIMDEHLNVESTPALLGSETIKKFRDAGYQGLIISCTGNCSAHDKELYLAAGADNVWPKPYPAPAVLLKDLQSWIRQKKARTTPTNGASLVERGPMKLCPRALSSVGCTSTSKNELLNSQSKSQLGSGDVSAPRCIRPFVAMAASLGGHDLLGLGVPVPERVNTPTAPTPVAAVACSSEYSSAL